MVIVNFVGLQNNVLFHFPGSNGPSPFGGEGGGIAEWNDPMWDKLYGGEEDDDVGDMSQQSSMIGHLLSQVTNLCVCACVTVCVCV